MKTRRRNYDEDGFNVLHDCLPPVCAAPSLRDSSRFTMKIKRNYDKDRFSVLPDCLLLLILSHLNSKQVVRTCILSTRWKNIWKDLHVLSIDSCFFTTLRSFTNFEPHILSLRNDKTPLQALNFKSLVIDPHLVKRILNYASSPNLQLLHMSIACHMDQLSICNFSSHTLTSLNLTSYLNRTYMPLLFPNSLVLPALTYFAIHCFSFRCDDDGYANPFSAFKSLNTLIILYCQVSDNKSLSISSVSLVNLTIEPSEISPYKFELSTPNLIRFYFRGAPLDKLCGRNSNSSFSSIKHVKIDLPIWAYVKCPSILCYWLHELALMESLTICSKTLQILHLTPNSSKIDFPNLKLLKIETYDLSSEQDGMGDFLIQNAPSAKKVIIHLSFPKYRYEEERVVFLHAREFNIPVAFTLTRIATACDMKRRELYFSMPENSIYPWPSPSPALQRPALLR